MKNKEMCGFCNSEILRYPTKTNTFFCDNNCKSSWQVLQREKLGYTKEWLIDQYFEKNKTCNDIAKDIGRNSKRVWEWFRQYGIEVSKRGNYKPVHFKKGESLWLGKTHTQETKDKIREARIKDGHVPYLKNGEHWLKGVKSEGHPNYKGGLTPERQSFYCSNEWSEVVKKVWKRDNAICQICKKHHNTTESRGTFHIHHIVSFMVREKRAELENLVLLCGKCHRWVHSNKNIEKQFIK